MDYQIYLLLKFTVPKNVIIIKSKVLLIHPWVQRQTILVTPFRPFWVSPHSSMGATLDNVGCSIYALLVFSSFIHGCNARQFWLFRLGPFGFLLTHPWVQRQTILVFPFRPFWFSPHSSMGATLDNFGCSVQTLFVFSSLIYWCNVRQFWLFRLGPFGFLLTPPWVQHQTILVVPLKPFWFSPHSSISAMLDNFGCSVQALLGVSLLIHGCNVRQFWLFGLGIFWFSPQSSMYATLDNFCYSVQALLVFSSLIPGCNVRQFWLFCIGLFGFLLTHPYVQCQTILVVPFRPFWFSPISSICAMIDNFGCSFRPF